MQHGCAAHFCGRLSQSLQVNPRSGIAASNGRYVMFTLISRFYTDIENYVREAETSLSRTTKETNRSWEEQEKGSEELLETCSGSKYIIYLHENGLM